MRRKQHSCRVADDLECWLYPLWKAGDERRGLAVCRRVAPPRRCRPVGPSFSSGTYQHNLRPACTYTSVRLVRDRAGRPQMAATRAFGWLLIARTCPIRFALSHPAPLRDKTRPRDGARAQRGRDLGRPASEHTVRHRACRQTASLGHSAPPTGEVLTVMSKVSQATDPGSEGQAYRIGSRRRRVYVRESMTIRVGSDGWAHRPARTLVWSSSALGHSRVQRAYSGEEGPRVQCQGPGRGDESARERKRTCAGAIPCTCEPEVGRRREVPQLCVVAGWRCRIVFWPGHTQGRWKVREGASR